MGELVLTVGDEARAQGLRLDAFVHVARPGLSRRLVRRLIAEGAVRVNGRPATKGTRLRPGDRVILPALAPTVAPEPELPLRVVHEDALLVAVDKPGGMASHALDPRERGTAAAFLLARYPEMVGVGDPLAPGLLHRLDTGTSGLLLAARTPDAHRAVRAALRARLVEKRYLAIVSGPAHGLEGVCVTVPLAHDPGDRRRMIPASAGQRAWAAATTLAVLVPGVERSLVRAMIRTGVTHQVRVHLAHLGHPVLGDRLYGGPAAGLPPGRHALHASGLSLPHPAGGGEIELESPLPPDLRALL